MKKMKTVLLCLCSVTLALAAVMDTMAYLISRDSVVNTFTVGQVDITLDETAVDTNGTPIPGADRVKGNEYHLIPGHTYTKDPVITVAQTSEAAYIRMLVTFNKQAELDAVFAEQGGADLLTIFNGYDPAKWIYEGVTEDSEANTVTYEFRYFEPADGTSGDLEPLFESFTLPEELDGDKLSSLSSLQITIVGHAIQKAGFDTSDAAWVAFDNQVNG